MVKHKYNKIIAEFMGAKKTDKREKINPTYIFPSFSALKLEEEPDYNGGYAVDLVLSKVWQLHDMQFNTSWDWLMPVVEKIESLDYEERVTHTYTVEITGNGTSILPSIWTGKRWLIRHNSRNRRLMNTYEAIIEFIERYNESGGKLWAKDF